MENLQVPSYVIGTPEGWSGWAPGVGGFERWHHWAWFEAEAVADVAVDGPLRGPLPILEDYFLFLKFLRARHVINCRFFLFFWVLLPSLCSIRIGKPKPSLHLWSTTISNYFNTRTKSVDLLKLNGRLRIFEKLNGFWTFKQLIRGAPFHSCHAHRTVGV